MGAHILYELVNGGKPVRAIYRDRQKIDNANRIFGYYGRDDEELWRSIEWVEADINDYFSVVQAMDGAEIVYHAAGYVSFNDHEQQKLNRINFRGTRNIVNAGLETGIKTLCHVSSIATLGEIAGNGIISEDLIWNQGHSATAYAKSKFWGEMDVWRGIYEGLNAVIVNPSVVVGPGMWLGTGKELFYSIFKGLKYYPVGSSGYVDVRDVARIMVLLTENGLTGERFILNGENLAHRDFIALISEKMGLPAPHIQVTPLLMNTAIFAEKIRAFFTASSPRINKRTMEIAREMLVYSNKKVLGIPDVQFTPIKDTVKLAVQLFMKEVAGNDPSSKG